MSSFRNASDGVRSKTLAPLNLTSGDLNFTVDPFRIREVYDETSPKLSGRRKETAHPIVEGVQGPPRRAVRASGDEQDATATERGENEGMQGGRP